MSKEVEYITHAERKTVKNVTYNTNLNSSITRVIRRALFVYGR